MNTASIIAAALLWLFTIVRWVKFRNTPGQRALTHSIAALAIAATLFIPAISSLINSTLGFPQAATLMLFASGAFAALALIGAIRFMTLPESKARGGALLRRSLIAIAVAGIGVTLLIGQPPGDTISSPWPASSHWAMYAFWTLWLGFVIVTTGWISVKAFRQASRLRPSRIRTCVYIVSASAACGTLYAITKGILVAASTQSMTLPWLSILSQAFSIFMLILLGIASVMAALPASKRLQALRDQHAIERIRPLWQSLRIVDPDMQLESGTDDLYRMVIECRDWMRQLRFVLPATAWAEATASASKITSVQPANAIATAGWIEAALRARAIGLVPARPSSMPPAAADLDTEIEFLEDVAAVPAEQVQQVAAAIRTVDDSGSVKPEIRVPRSDAHSQPKQQ